LLGARASIEAAAVVADLLARELGRDEAWKKQAVADYKAVAQGYLLQDAARG
jgi:glycerol-3-phosphate dehydrogenase